MKQSTNQLVEHFFRHESANLLAVLTRAFGMRRIDLIEDMIQVAMLEAMRAWKQRGVPENPAAWIHRVAKRRILDALRREATHEKALSRFAWGIGDPAAQDQVLEDQAKQLDRWLDAEHLPDSLLRMMFVCCEPALERKTQIALTLRILCGFSNSEIGHGLLLPTETIKKRIQRAKRGLASADVQLELPPAAELSMRLDVVHDVLYLMFNEGYSRSEGLAAIRDDICEEAVRLCHLLCQSELAVASSRALLALLLFHAARLEARVDAEGAVILLEDQDRRRWDGRLIAEAQCWLVNSKTDQPTVLHLEAAIAMQHCVAASVESTDWTSIVALYTRLLQLRDSPVYVLNRAIALAQSGDSADAMSQLEALRASGDLKGYLWLDGAIARIHELDGDVQAAIDGYRRAFQHARADHEKQLLKRKLDQLGADRFPAG